MRREQLADLAVFLAVAEERSFTRAASKLGTSQSAVSQTVRRLETDMGVKLLTRSTRTVAPTAAGDELIEVLRPALTSIDQRIGMLSALRDRPTGTVRITTSRHAAETVLWPKLSELLASHPDIIVELSIDSALTDIITDRFDAGVRLGEHLAKDMIAARIGPELRLAVVGSPDYFAHYGRPDTPHELTAHRCINLRLATRGGLNVWEFEKAGRQLNVRVNGPLILNDSSLVLRAAEDGLGLACVMEDLAAPALADKRLVRVLEDWCEPFAGYHLFYPDRHQLPAAFKLVVDALRIQS